MKFDEKKFREYLLINGAMIDKWPPEDRDAAYEALAGDHNLQEILNDEIEFEDFLGSRRFEEASPVLPQRIISAGFRGKNAGGIYQGLLGYFFVFFGFRRYFAAAFVLTMILIFAAGFTVGYFEQTNSAATGNDSYLLREFLNYQGEII